MDCGTDAPNLERRDGWSLLEEDGLRGTGVDAADPDQVHPFAVAIAAVGVADLGGQGDVAVQLVAKPGQSFRSAAEVEVDPDVVIHGRRWGRAAFHDPEEQLAVVFESVLGAVVGVRGVPQEGLDQPLGGDLERDTATLNSPVRGHFDHGRHPGTSNDGKS